MIVSTWTQLPEHRGAGRSSRARPPGHRHPRGASFEEDPAVRNRRPLSVRATPSIEPAAQPAPEVRDVEAQELADVDERERSIDVIAPYPLLHLDESRSI